MIVAIILLLLSPQSLPRANYVGTAYGTLTTEQVLLFSPQSLPFPGPGMVHATAAAGYTDNFTRANESPLAGNWTAVRGTINLTSNAFIGTGGDDNIYRWNANTFTDNQYCDATIASFGSGGYVGCGVRMASGSNDSYTCISPGGASLLLRRNAAGTVVNLATATPAAINTGDVIRLEVTGQNTSTQLTCKVNGNTEITHTDNAGSALNSGYSGISTYAGGSGNLWHGGNL